MLDDILVSELIDTYLLDSHKNERRFFNSVNGFLKPTRKYIGKSKKVIFGGGPPLPP